MPVHFDALSTSHHLWPKTQFNYKFFQEGCDKIFPNSMASAALLCVWPYHFIISGFSAFDFSPALCLDTCFVVEKSNLNPNSNLSRDKNCLYVLPTYLVLVVHAAAAAAKSLQSCPTLCNPIDGSPPGSAVPGIFQARVLEWGAIAFSCSVAKSRPIISSSAFSLLYGPTLTSVHNYWKNHHFATPCVISDSDKDPNGC